MNDIYKKYNGDLQFIKIRKSTYISAVIIIQCKLINLSIFDIILVSCSELMKILHLQLIVCLSRCVKALQFLASSVRYLEYAHYVCCLPYS